MPRILIADDEPAIRAMLATYLSDEGYQISQAPDGREALNMLEKDPGFDLVLSDINMPHMKGPELLALVEKRFPHIRRVLITAYNIDEYLSFAIEYGTTNIVTKTAPFNFGELSAVIKNLLEGRIFGLDRYLKAGASIQSFPVLSPKLIKDYAMVPVNEFKDSSPDRNLQLVMIELLYNAVYYGVKNMDGEHKEEWHTDFELKAGEVEVHYGRDEEKYGVSVVDNGGRLTKASILHWLSRQIVKDEQGLPQGLLDTHGRGLFISRIYGDRMVVNIERSRRTEIICLNYFKKAFAGAKPLLINEI